MSETVSRVQTIRVGPGLHISSEVVLAAVGVSTLLALPACTRAASTPNTSVDLQETATPTATLTPTLTPDAVKQSVAATLEAIKKKQQIATQVTATVAALQLSESPTATVQAITKAPQKNATPTATLMPTATLTLTAEPTGVATATETRNTAQTEAFKGYAPEKALLDASQNLSNKTHEDVRTLYREYMALFQSMPDMANVATSSDAALMPTRESAHNLTEKTYRTTTDAGGFTFLSASEAVVNIDGTSLKFDFKPENNRLIFVMGDTNGVTQKNVTIEQYPQGHGYTANATPDAFQKGMLKSSDKSIYDVWLADQVMQSVKGGSNQGIGVEKTVTIDFIDPKTNKVTEFVYDVTAKTWTKDGVAVGPKSATALTPETVTPAAPVTEAQAMEAAIKNLEKVYGLSESDAKTLFESVYNTLPSDMPFMAKPAEGLFPNTLNGKNLMTEPSKNKNNPTEILNAAEHGFETYSGGWFFGIIDGKWDLQLPSQANTAYNVYFVGKTSDAGPIDKNTNIGAYDYMPKYNYVVGASPDKGQESKYDGRKVLDPVWVADGIAQAKLVNPNTTTVVDVFVDCETGKVVKYSYDLTTGTWTKIESTLPLK